MACQLAWLEFVSSNKVKLGKDAFAMEGRCEILDVGNRVTVWDGVPVEGPVVPTWARQSPGVFLGTMCSGDAQLLEDNAQFKHVLKLLTAQAFWCQTASPS